MKIPSSVCTTLLLAGNVQSFTLSSYSPSKTNINIKERTWNQKSSISSSSLPLSKWQDDDYDYEELMNDPVEKGRFDNNYVMFDNEKWLAHRASDRFYRTLLNFNRNPIVESLIDEVAVLMAISVVIILWNELLIEGFTDFNGIHRDALFPESALIHNFRLELPMEPFLISGGPLGFLLVFRNDASFGRYRNALHLWELVVSKLSNMLLMASNASSDKEKVREMGIASWVLVRTLQHEVSGENDPLDKYESDVRAMIPDQKKADQILTARNKLYRAQYDLHQTIEPFTDEVTVLDKRTLINTVNEVAISCAECERLYKTPVPLLYTRQTLKFVTFWVTTLPFALYDVFGKSWNHIYLIPGIAIMAFLFFGVEEIAVALEEPFSILPLGEFVEEFSESIDDVTEWMGSPNSSSGAKIVESKQDQGEVVPANGRK